MIKFSTMIAGSFSAPVLIIPVNSYISTDAGINTLKHFLKIVVTHILTDNLLLK